MWEIGEGEGVYMHVCVCREEVKSCCVIPKHLGARQTFSVGCDLSYIICICIAECINTRL